MNKGVASREMLFTLEGKICDAMAMGLNRSDSLCGPLGMNFWIMKTLINF
jgi:hypothetical protein